MQAQKQPGDPARRDPRLRDQAGPLAGGLVRRAAARGRARSLHRAGYARRGESAVARVRSDQRNASGGARPGAVERVESAALGTCSGSLRLGIRLASRNRGRWRQHGRLVVVEAVDQEVEVVVAVPTVAVQAVRPDAPGGSVIRVN